MERVHQINPFSKRDSHDKNAILAYKVFTTLTWILSIAVTFYYTFSRPHDGSFSGHTIWEQNDLHLTAFRLNKVIASVYWIVLFILQGGYIAHLFSANVDTLNAAAAVGSHFILNNLFQFAFVMLFVRSYFGWAELILILNFVNLTSLYFRHPAYARFIHEAVVSGPLAWAFVAIYWNGAIMVPHAASLVARIFGNVFIWSILVYGLFYIVAYKDYTMGFNLSVLSAAIGVSQFLRQFIAFQWIFAFTIMATLFVATVGVAVPAATGKDFGWRRQVEADTERAPLLRDENN
ncbi:hypothetical protein BKA67DRAFT_652860 [Truncatella angustata]|uniref:ATP synthase F0 n=1 Tax=Truncatella angustata TaxID=152316 RepID=A0A9P8UW51_9PEZI|nr:uncharacterized protein BKA67DRAFT_652860 [Truncatella angustata]KAH6659636.1 hypothetical protein BKA67DRAFT_652860 [Truncatella angustata]KAH8201267.1 hypothetical protein TruAng_004584 [Truncatella angustata]